MNKSIYMISLPYQILGSTLKGHRYLYNPKSLWSPSHFYPWGIKIKTRILKLSAVFYMHHMFMASMTLFWGLVKSSTFNTYLRCPLFQNTFKLSLSSPLAYSCSIVYFSYQTFTLFMSFSPTRFRAPWRQDLSKYFCISSAQGYTWHLEVV